LESLAHLVLTFAVGVCLETVNDLMEQEITHIYLGGVEEVDTLVPSCLHAVLYDGTLLGTTVCKPSTERKDGDLETGAAKVAVDLWKWLLEEVLLKQVQES